MCIRDSHYFQFHDYTSPRASDGNHRVHTLVVIGASNDTHSTLLVSHTVQSLFLCDPLHGFAEFYNTSHVHQYFPARENTSPNNQPHSCRQWEREYDDND